MLSEIEIFNFFVSDHLNKTRSNFGLDPCLRVNKIIGPDMKRRLFVC